VGRAEIGWAEGVARPTRPGGKVRTTSAPAVPILHRAGGKIKQTILYLPAPSPGLLFPSAQRLRQAIRQCEWSGV
jgi:hypothetical protein